VRFDRFGVKIKKWREYLHLLAILPIIERYCMIARHFVRKLALLPRKMGFYLGKNTGLYEIWRSALKNGIYCKKD